MSEQTKRVEDLLKRTETLEAGKQNFLNLYQEIGDLFRPVRSDIISKKTAGDKESFKRIFDSFPILAVETFASILLGVLTNKSTKWFNLQTVDGKLGEINTVSTWLSQATEVMWNKLYNPASGFEQALLEAFKDVGAFGTVATLIEEGSKFDLVFITQNIRNYLVSENSEGRVDSIITKAQFSARQAIEKFGSDVNEQIKKIAEKNPYELFDFQLHIYPRSERDKTKIDAINKAYAGCWVDVKHKEIVKEIGWDSFPVAVGRSEKSTDELYGTSRAMIALADARELNAIQQRYAESVELRLRPPLIQNADFAARLNLSPGAINKATQNASYAGRSAIEPINTVGDLNGTLELAQEKKQSIREIFFLDKMKIFDNPNATATQVLELRAEGFRIMSSVATSIQEYLDAILDRTFDILFRKSYAVNDLDGGGSSFNLLPGAVFPEMPDELKNAPELKVVFVNPINQSQQTIELNGIDVLINTVGSIAQISPDVMDVVNFDNVLRKKRSILNIDPELINDEKTVKQIRQERQSQQQQQQALMNQEIDSKAAKNYAQAE